MPEKLIIRNISHNTSVTTDQPSRTEHSPVDDSSVISDNTSQNLMPNKQKTMIIFAITAAVTLLLGSGTGYAVYNATSVNNNDNVLSSGETIQTVAGDSVEVGDIFGSADEEAFKDVAQGYLQIGGVNGEGSHKLLREGGVSQTVALTSSVTDLSKLDGMEVRVWGETHKSSEAGWLMDVGRVEVLNTQGNVPTEE